MRQEAWLEKHAGTLAGKTVVVTGATGGLGLPICRAVVRLGGKLVTVNRSPEKSEVLARELKKECPEAEITCLLADLSRIDTVRTVCHRLNRMPVDVLVLNAGAYAIPRCTCSTGFDNVFTINFLSHYYMVKQLLPLLARRKGKVIALGSIAHRYSKSDPDDVDFSTRTRCNLVYGNSKRYLMFALTELMKHHPEVDFAIAHPGITFTNITNHYPPLLFAIIRGPMKIIFMKPASAARSVIQAFSRKIPLGSWIGPRLFHIWGNPAVSILRSCPPEEQQRLYGTAEKIYGDILSKE